MIAIYCVSAFIGLVMSGCIFVNYQDRKMDATLVDKKHRSAREVLPGIWYDLYTSLEKITEQGGYYKDITDRLNLFVFNWVRQHPLTTSWDCNVPALSIEGLDKLARHWDHDYGSFPQKDLLPYLVIE